MPIWARVLRRRALHQRKRRDGFGQRHLERKPILERGEAAAKTVAGDARALRQLDVTDANSIEAAHPLGRLRCSRCDDSLARGTFLGPRFGISMFRKA